MITKTMFKKLDTNGIVPFSVIQDTTLEVLTEKPSSEGVLKTFIANGTFNGELVSVRIQKRMDDGNFIPYGEGDGYMVRNDDNSGFWLVPVSITKQKDINSIIELENNLIITKVEDLITGNSDLIIGNSDLIIGNSDKKILGFTYKQLAIIAVLLLIVRKI